MKRKYEVRLIRSGRGYNRTEEHVIRVCRTLSQAIRVADAWYGDDTKTTHGSFQTKYFYHHAPEVWVIDRSKHVMKEAVKYKTTSYINVRSCEEAGYF